MDIPDEWEDMGVPPMPYAGNQPDQNGAQPAYESMLEFLQDDDWPNQQQPQYAGNQPDHNGIDPAINMPEFFQQDHCTDQQQPQYAGNQPNQNSVHSYLTNMPELPQHNVWSNQQQSHYAGNEPYQNSYAPALNMPGPPQHNPQQPQYADGQPDQNSFAPSMNMPELPQHNASSNQQQPQNSSAPAVNMPGSPQQPQDADGQPDQNGAPAMNMPAPPKDNSSANLQKPKDAGDVPDQNGPAPSDKAPVPNLVQDPTITVKVGQARSFSVPLSKLGPLRSLCVDNAKGLELPAVDPDVFALIVDWSKGIRLPQLLPDLGVGPDNIAPPPQVIILTPDKKPVVLFHLGADLAQYKDTDVVQDRLFDIMLFAEKYKWEALFNDAIDAFRMGEVTLKRNRPSLAHIEKAYRPEAGNAGVNTCVRIFMADYAFVGM